MIIDKSSPQGNAFVIMAKVSECLRKSGHTKEDIDKAMEEMQSGDYDNLCKVAERVTNGSIRVR